jgi:hypothetical protein
MSRGFWRELGDRTEARQSFSDPAYPPDFSISQTVYEPSLPNTQFGLLPGQSITLSSRDTTTVLQPLGRASSTSTSTITYGFERRESIVVGGKSYDTCRYREAESGAAEVTTTWYIVGLGLPALLEIQSATQVRRFKIRSGSYRGTPF